MQLNKDFFAISVVEDSIVEEGDWICILVANDFEIYFANWILVRQRQSEVSYGKIILKKRRENLYNSRENEVDICNGLLLEVLEL